MLNRNAAILGVVAIATGFALSHYTSAANAATRAKPRRSNKPAAGPGAAAETPPTLRDKYSAALDAALSPRLLCMCTAEGSNLGSVGLVGGNASGAAVTAHCGVSDFTPAGKAAGWFRCDTFILLNRAKRPSLNIDW